MQNARYAELLSEIADLLQVSGANPFKVRAFQKAARVVDGLSDDLDTWIAQGRVEELDGIGSSIAADLEEMHRRGSCSALDELREILPAGIADMLQVQGLGPKKVQKIWESLGIGDLGTLEAAAQEGRIAALAGFGAKSEANILKEIERLRRNAGRMPVARAWPLAMALLADLRSLPEVERAEAAGSLRRGRETVGDLDFVVASAEPGPVMEAFVSHESVEEIIARGETKSSVHLKAGLSADLRVVPADVFGATLHHFTGSKDHNVHMRSRALRQGLRVSEWGVFRRSEEGEEEERIACATEEEVYAAVGLAWIPPELREDGGEFEAAEQDALPGLIALDAIVSDLHMHTEASDGRHTIAAMAEAAAARGLTHIAITDHSESLRIANGLSADRLRAQIDAIDAYNADAPACRVLKGLEVDILEDGSLDMDTDVLTSCDWIVASVHQWMNQPPEVMTERLLRAIGSGLISAIGHPTGRIIGRRDPFSFDTDRIFSACADAGVALEVNASPWRLDLNARLLRSALEHEGLLITINTDAHATAELDQMHFGVRMARRGWVPRERVLNALPLDAFLRARRTLAPA